MGPAGPQLMEKTPMRMPIRSLLAATTLSCTVLPAVGPSQAFCGFYVAKADARLFNKASKVVVARKGEQTAVTMASDYQGDLKEFALVIPVPTVVSKDQIKVVESAWVDHLDAYSAPRLVEYFDPDPCLPANRDPRVLHFGVAVSGMPDMKKSAPALGVKIEAEYTVGEYDILILSATQCDWHAPAPTESGYKIPAGAAPVLGSYIKQSMKFFVARVNLAEQSKLGFQYLRPDPGQLCEPQVHAADPARHGERQRPAGHDRANADREGACRDHQLPHREDPLQPRCPDLHEIGVRQLLSRHVRPSGRKGRHARRLSRIRVGHGLVRPVRRRSPTQR